MWNLLLDNLASKGVRLNPEEIAILQTLFTHKKYRKHQYLLQQGDTCRYESFIIKGIARIYQVDDKGQEHILQFTPEDWWTGDLYSFLTGTPSQYNVDCLEDTEVLRITKSDLDVLFEKVPRMNVYFRILYQNSIIAYNRRLGSALSKSALERYQEFIDRYPLVEQRVPNHQIASFLGITPQSLSRLRKQSMSVKKLT
jgi:CRP-like cAMP-binding protein